MKLSYVDMETVFSFDVGVVNTLVIESPDFFRIFLSDIYNQMSGFPGKAVLSRNDMPISFSANAELIDSFLSFQMSRKSLVNKIAAKLESIAVDETHYVRTSELVAEWEQYILELSLDLPCGIVCDKLNFNGILRSSGIRISEDYGNDLERLLDYMELTRDLEHEKLFIFVNLRSYYSDKEVERFVSSAISHEFQILLVDSVSHCRLCQEKRVTIDNDLCEF